MEHELVLVMISSRSSRLLRNLDEQLSIMTKTSEFFVSHMSNACGEFADT